MKNAEIAIYKALVEKPNLKLKAVFQDTATWTHHEFFFPPAQQMESIYYNKWKKWGATLISNRWNYKNPQSKQNALLLEQHE